MNQNLLSSARQEEYVETKNKDVNLYRHFIAAPLTPSIFTLELTTLCNNACSGCANIEVPAARRKKHYQDMADWEKIILKIKPYAKLIRISGGEPTLHKDFPAIIKYLEEHQLPHAILTTGRWDRIKKEKLLNLYQQCNYFVGFLISLHGSQAKSHNAFVQSSTKAFRQTCTNIQDASREGLTVYTNSVLTTHACAEIQDIVRLSQDLGAEYHLFNRFLTPAHPLEPDEQTLLQAIAQIEQLRSNGVPCRIGNNIPFCFAESSAEGAKAGYELCHISPQGEIRPDNLSHFSFGNILQNKISEIWNSSKSHLYRLSCPPECLGCQAFSLCRGGAKSLILGHGLSKDKLMKGPKDTFHIPEKDPLKSALSYLALTSD